MGEGKKGGMGGIEGDSPTMPYLLGLWLVFIIILLSNRSFIISFFLICGCVYRLLHRLSLCVRVMCVCGVMCVWCVVYACCVWCNVCGVL